MERYGETRGQTNELKKGIGQILIKKRNES